MNRGMSFVHRRVPVAIAGVAAVGALCICIAAAGDSPETPAAGAAPSTQPADPARGDLEAAWGAIQMADWKTAAGLLTAAERRASDDEVHAEVLFALAHVRHHGRPGNDLAEARSLYTRVADEYPDTKAAPWAKLTLGRIVDTPEFEPKTERELQRNRAEAQRLYQRVLTDHPGHLAAHEAALRLGVTYLGQRGDDEAERVGAEILIAYLAEHPDNYLAAQMNILVGEWRQRNGREREAVQSFIAAYRAGLPSMQHRATTCFRIAQIAEFRLGDDALAAEWYQRLQDEAPADGRYYASRVGAERCRGRLARRAEGVSP